MKITTKKKFKLVVDMKSTTWYDIKVAYEITATNDNNMNLEN